MKIDYSTNNQNKQSFGAIKYNMAKDTLRSVLSLKELEEFKSLVEQNKNNNLVDTVLFGEGKKLTAKVIDVAILKDSFREKLHSPRLFESKMHFIKRVVKEMVKRTPKVEELVKKQNFEL